MLCRNLFVGLAAWVIGSVSVSPAPAGVPGGVAIVAGFHLTPAADSLAFPLPPSPAALDSSAPAPGLYDAWLFLHTRRPMIGAWSITLGLDYDGAPGSGVDVLAWESFTDEFQPHPGWPSAGPNQGFFARFHRYRCLDPQAFMIPGDDGWWVQPVVRLRVRVYGPDRIDLADPEPRVSPHVVECLDEEHAFDDSSWTGFIPATFGAAGPGLPFQSGQDTPIEAETWGALKARFRDRP